MQSSWLDQVQLAVNSFDRRGFAALFDPAGTSPAFVQLGQSLNPSEKSFAGITKRRFADNPPMAQFTAAYLLFVRTFSRAGPSEDLLLRCELLKSCFVSLDRGFMQQESAFMVGALKKFTSALVSVSLEAGNTGLDPQYERARDVSNALTRPLLVASSDRSTDPETRRDALFYVANQAFRIYFAISKLRLCDTVLKYTRPWLDSLDQFPKSDRVRFAFYRGRFYLYQRQLVLARRDLKHAMELCHVRHPKFARQILVYLTAASLPIGYFPKPALLQEFNLEAQFGPLINYLRQGNFKGVLAELNTWQDWHVHYGNFLVLREKLELLCWRNLCRVTLYMVTNGHPQPETGPPTLRMTAVLKLARVAFPQTGFRLDVDDVEGICQSLLDQGYLKAYILHSKRLLVLQKNPPYGFPPVASLYPMS